MTSKYQVMPDLTEKEYEDLKADIQERGVLIPVEYDEDGAILDGHHRVKICQELGINWPRLVRQGMTEQEKKSHAMTLNLTRRHLSKEKRRELWAEMRQAGMTLEAIAEADGTVGKSTVYDALVDQFSDFGKLPDTTIKTFLMPLCDAEKYALKVFRPC